jgi:uncharacterized membrane protein YgaE (UPF0421/DUF939 family)
MILNIVLAAWSNSSVFWETMALWDFILLAISLFVLFAWVLSIVFILWWGLLLILSGGKDDKIKPAINTIRYAIIGVVITVVSIFIFPILWRLLWLDVEKYANPDKIFQTIESIWNKVFWGWDVKVTNSNINSIDELWPDFSDL